MNGEEGRGGPFKRLATWIAEGIANFLLGKDVLAPDHEGTEIDWDGVEFQKPRRTIVAVMPRMQLELALTATQRRVENALDEESCREFIKRAKLLKEEQSYAAKLSEDCSMTLTGRNDGDLEAEVNGAGAEFDALCDELWGRSKEVREGAGKTPSLSAGKNGLS